MSKLPKEHKFIDLSDYGRIPAKIIANSIKNTSVSPIQVTVSFIISGIIAIVCIFNNQFWLAGFFLILKSVLDAADGELARIKKTPSYTGRYFDSVSDIILNIFIFLALWHITDSNILTTILAVFGIQLQGTLYNYYYTILRNKHNGDTTSRVFENEVPMALPGEKQKHVNILFGLYKILYGGFDKIIYRLDRSAAKSKNFPNWLMTLVSTFGLGFQLLVISIMLVSGLKDDIIPFFIFYSLLIFVFIGIRKIL
ncbi:CDP-alcohol phosphatidyltransferase family protein [Xanthomarina sp. F1114]|uniref:CDP-alcohol phosphatidyltransferase family protein n=1 Tax=Xanthomarina sp. F1114 TaxID=2996019 RepID=UPI00225E5826|nr:CDP-alcohol phosphatidyltransferase family protein [Xanthomarina sp. F1114]MCX7547409.1 CDP-alcohol phosphatidyltransferase family protein [Xanthomarina sp. F1114]